MSKAEDGRITPETEHPNLNRRSALMLAAGAAAVSAVPATAASAPSFSPEFLECKRLWAGLEEEGTNSPLYAEYMAARDALVERPIRSIKPDHLKSI